MRRLLFIIIGLLGLMACKTDKTSVPLDFECFNQPHIYIKYKQPINEYTVKVMWLQNGEVGNALFCLEKQGIQYYCFAEKWTDKILYDKGNTYPNNTVIELDYTAKLKSEEYLSDDSPFFFSDVDDKAIGAIVILESLACDVSCSKPGSLTGFTNTTKEIITDNQVE